MQRPQLTFEVTEADLNMPMTSKPSWAVYIQSFTYLDGKFEKSLKNDNFDFSNLS